MSPLLIELSQASGVPYYRQVFDQVALLVRSGQLAPGTRLPSVRELSRELLVSLITVRRSYADLEAEGLIVRRQGQGTFVADEIETASRKQAVAEARDRLAGAVAHARRLGVETAELRELVDAVLVDQLERQEEKDEKETPS